MHVISRMSLDEIYSPLGIRIWLNVNYNLSSWFYARSYCSNFSQASSGCELASVFTLVLQTNWLTKCANHPKSNANMTTNLYRKTAELLLHRTSHITELYKKNIINPFVPNALFLYPLKTSENLKISENRKVFWCFQGLEKRWIWDLMG